MAATQLAAEKKNSKLAQDALAAEKKKSELAEAALLIEMKKSQEAGNALKNLGKQKETFEFSRDRFKRLHQQAQEVINPLRSEALFTAT